jgi:hypothetical protein
MADDASELDDSSLTFVPDGSPPHSGHDISTSWRFSDSSACTPARSVVTSSAIRPGMRSSGAM